MSREDRLKAMTPDERATFWRAYAEGAMDTALELQKAYGVACRTIASLKDKIKRARREPKP